MENDVSMERLFFELASETRLCILRVLQKENLKMQEIARRLDVTATEAFRQLERLSDSLLVQKQPEGTFAITEYGKLILQLTSSLEFVSKYKDYFSTHDLMRLPIHLINRLGELSRATVMTDTVENINIGGRAFTEAEQYGYAIAEGTVTEQMIPIMNQQFQKGLKFKMLIPEKRLLANPTPPAIAKNFEARGLPELPAILFLTEKEAGVCFFQVGGRVDYAAFYGRDPTFLSWVNDLFLHYWEKGERT